MANETQPKKQTDKEFVGITGNGHETIAADLLSLPVSLEFRADGSLKAVVLGTDLASRRFAVSRLACAHCGR
ncbi:MAG: hypothetical protein WBE13_13865 [Candidatus Acidiferrum sp.]